MVMAGWATLSCEAANAAVEALEMALRLDAKQSKQAYLDMANGFARMAEFCDGRASAEDTSEEK
jgi:hypothetical protein